LELGIVNLVKAEAASALALGDPDLEVLALLACLSEPVGVAGGLASCVDDHRVLE